MKTIHRILTPIFSILVFPAAIFLPMFRIMISSGLSASEEGKTNLLSSFGLGEFISLKDLYETYLPAFEACIRDAKVESVMGAYNRTNGEPCCGSKALLVDTVRGKWGFEGHIVSDCWDLNCGNMYLQILSAYEQGLVTEEQITLSAERLFTTRYLLGIMGEGSEFDAIPYEKVECNEHLALAQTAAQKACVLLKNDGLLPLDPKTVGTIGVIGPNANSRVALVGNYHGTASRYVTILEGVQDAVGTDGRVLYSEGCHLFKERVEHLGLENDRIAEAVVVAKRSNVVVLVLGLDETLEGEEGDTGNAAASGDKLDLLLPESQRILMDKVLEVGKPTIVILMAGSAIDLSAAQEKASAILLPWYPGAGGGKAVADILFGKCPPLVSCPLPSIITKHWPKCRNSPTMP